MCGGVVHAMLRTKAQLLLYRMQVGMPCGVSQGAKLTLYRRCQHEIFARFGDCSRWDGMVERLVLYADEERTAVVEIRETFTRRRDKLRERRVYPHKVGACGREGKRHSCLREVQDSVALWHAKGRSAQFATRRQTRHHLDHASAGGWNLSAAVT